MKIYSKGREATVTFITSHGIVFTVGHFYRGNPVLIENKIPVKVLTISKNLDYLIGITPLRIGAKINLLAFDYNMPIIIKGNTEKYGRIIEPVDNFRWLTSIPVVEGESGSPVIDPETKAIIGYVTHGVISGSIIIPIASVYNKIQDAIEKASKLISEEKQESSK